MTRPPFTLDGYRATIQGILARGYSVADFFGVDPNKQHLILRHDIDQSIARAKSMAELEAAQSWRASYFVLMRTNMYNPWSRDNARDLRLIANMGHEVGLHLDASYYTDSERDAGAATECRHLEDITGRPVRIVSFHRPATNQIGGEVPIAGRLHTYMDRFTKTIGYSSDSRGEWHHGHPFDHVALHERRALQLLTHAVWWVGSEWRTPRDRLVDILDETAARLKTELSQNNKAWNATDTRELRIEPLMRNIFEKMPDAFVSLGRDMPDEYWTADHFLMDVPQKWQLSLAAWSKETPIGYAIVSAKSHTRAHLHHFVLGKDWRNEGIGSVLLDKVLNRARESGYSEMTLKVAKSNPARRFYERNGFRNVGEENNHQIYRRAI